MTDKTINELARISESQQSIQNIFLALQNLKAISSGQSPMEELGLQYRKDDQEDINQLRFVLSQNLTYPSSEIAEVHMKANRLGSLDYRNLQETRSMRQSLIADSKYCPCCGGLQQQNLLTLKTSIQNVNHIGISTYLYFITIKHIIFLLGILFAFYSVFAAATNIMASNRYKSDLGHKKVSYLKKTYTLLLMSSQGSKQQYQSSDDFHAFLIQCWLGVLVIAIWMGCFFCIKHRQGQASKNVNYSIKASDFTLLFQNKPKQLSINELEKQLQKYQLENISISSIQQQIKIEKVNQTSLFYLEKSKFKDSRLEQWSEQSENYKKQFIQWIQNRGKSATFKVSRDRRRRQYQRFRYLEERKIQVYKSIVQKISWQNKEKNKGVQMIPTFVTFKNTHNKLFLENITNQNKKNWFISKFCEQNEKLFHYRPATEPQDIAWTNLGKDFCTLIEKKIVTYSITIILLCISFWTVYALSLVKYRLWVYSKNNVHNRLLSLAISIVIPAFNAIIKLILQGLALYQRCQTHTQTQISLGFKSTLAVLVNTILVPIVANAALQNNIFGVNGLADDIIHLSFSLAFFSPLLKILNYKYLKCRLFKWYYNRPYRKLSLNQTQLNQYTGLMQFETGAEYADVVNLYIFSCFFVSLQPVIPIFAIMGLVFMYWVQKYCLYNRCLRPVPGNDGVNILMYQIIYFGPLMYTIGSICISDIFGSFKVGQVPNYVALFLSVITLCIPYNYIMNSRKARQASAKLEQSPNLTYEQNRKYFPSQYDRLNPVTAAKSVQDYIRYLKEQKIRLSGKSAQQRKLIQDQFTQQNEAPYRRSQHLIPGLTDSLGFGWLKKYKIDEMLVMKLLGGGASNSTNPYILGVTLFDLEQHKTGLAKPQVVAPNWLTFEQEAKKYNRYKNDEYSSRCQNFTFKLTDSVQYQRNLGNNKQDQVALTPFLNMFGNLLYNPDFIKEK